MLPGGAWACRSRAFKADGEPNVAVRTSKAECLRALKKATAELGRSPSKAEYEALGLRPASGTIIRVMGGWNQAKDAAGLRTNPSSGSRTSPKPPDVDVSVDTDWSDLTVDQRWHYKHVERNGRATMDRRASLRRWVYDVKSTSDGCKRCSESDPACLEYHHLDTEEKTMSISSLITYEPSKDRLREEIDKCVLLCANCHRKEHYDVPKPPE